MDRSNSSPSTHVTSVPLLSSTISTTIRSPSSSSPRPRSSSPNRHLPSNPIPDPDGDHHGEDDDDIEMSEWDRRPAAVSRPSEGHSSEPLLEEGSWEAERGRGVTSYDGTDEERRRHEMRSRSPASAAAKIANRRKYLLAAVFLVLSLVSFVVQTETAVYIQHELGWKKAYSMLYLTHGSWSALWPVQLLILKARKPHTPWRPFLRSHFHHLKTTAQMIQVGTTRLSPLHQRVSPWGFIIRKVLFITGALTVAGSTWYIAVNMTTPSDLTAIYNCSAFFAYVFSIFMLHEKPRKDKIFAVAVAIIGVLVVAYGDTKRGPGEEEAEAHTRVWGNVIIGVGSVLYGFYEVLYKKLACPPEGVSPGRSVIFANTVGTGIGIFTLTILWIPIPILHMLDIEKFEMPQGEAAWMLAVSVFANATFSGSFLVLISLTSPVLSSVASLLTIFLVAITDWAISGEKLSPAAVFGGLLIIAAFFLLSWSTWVEMNEERRKKEDDDDISTSDDE